MIFWRDVSDGKAVPLKAVPFKADIFPYTVS
jgi:hypothetical protein